MAMKIYGLKVTVMRCNNTYGRAREKGFFVEYVVSSMLADKTVYVGTPEHIRDYMYVDDHVEAYMRALEMEEAIGQVFNVSPGNPCTNLTLAEKTSQLVGFRGSINQDSYPSGYPMRPPNWDTDYIVLNSNLIRSALGWKPRFTIDEGLLRVVEMWRQSGAA
jgi:nucleoside-diphosphate-sugar epimerase